MQTHLQHPVTLLLAVLSLVGYGPAVAGPIPAGPEAQTQKEFVAELSQFYLKNVEDYQRLTRDPMPLRAGAQRFLTRFYEYYTGAAHATSAQELVEEGVQLTQAGAIDPLVRSCYAIALLRANRELEAEALLRNALDELEKSEYPARATAPAFVQYFVVLDRTIAGAKVRAPFIPRLTAQLARLWGQHKESAREQRFLWWTFGFMVDDSDLPADARVIYATARESTAIHPWLQKVIIGRHHIAHAWYHRGGGWAHTVKPEQWKKFEEHLRIAETELTDAWRMHPELPEAAHYMITVAKGGVASASPRQWFDRAVAAQMDYRPAYRSLLSALLPRWGGSYEQMLALADDCIATGRYDTIVPYMAIYTLFDIRTDMGVNSWEVFQNPPAWSRVRQVLGGYAAALQPADSVGFGYTGRFFNAVEALLNGVTGRDLECRAAFERLGDWAGTQNVFDEARTEWRYYRSRIYARTGPLGDLVRPFGEQAVDAAKRRDPQWLEWAVRSLDDFAGRDPQPQSELYYQSWQDQLRRDTDFASGKKVPIRFDDLGVFWSGGGSGRWERETDTAVTCTTRRSGPAFLSQRLLWRLSTAAPLEVEVEIQSAIGKRPNTDAGIVLGSYRDSSDAGDAGARYFFVNLAQACAGYQAGSKDPTCHRFQVLDVNTLRVIIWDGAFEMYVNGRYIAGAPWAGMKPGNLVSLRMGNLSWSKLRFSNLTIRRMPLPAPPPFGQHPQSVEYYTKRIEHDPHYILWYNRGVHRFYLKEYESAIADLNRSIEEGNGEGQPWTYRAMCRAAKMEYAAATADFREGVKRTPQHAFTQSQLAWHLATCPQAEERDGTAAIEAGTLACKISRNQDPFALAALAAAYGEVGDFHRALETAQQAVKIAPATRKQAYEEMLAMFQAQRPYRQSAGIRSEPQDDEQRSDSVD